MGLESDELLHLLALTQLPGIGPVTARNAIAYCGSATGVFRHSPGQLQKIPDVGPKLAHVLGQPPSLARAEKELRFAERTGVRVLTYLEPDFPVLLTTDASLPLVVFVKGTLNLRAQPAVAVVGTRKPSDYGRQQALRFAEAFARHGLNVVSGLAYGIDATAHKRALEVDGLTTAVLGHGLDRIYPPAHHSLADQIVAQGGALLTEFWSGTRPETNNFPARNRIIAGLSQATLVVEAAQTGGALITARMAFELNREVFAVPGSLDQPSFAGCNRLIQTQVAKLVTQPEDVFAELNLEPAAQPLPVAKATLSAAELAIWQRLPPNEGIHLDALALAVGLPVAELVARLLELEFRGWVRQLPGRRFAQVQP
ncbi:MAG: DNA-processing protein DprA [Bacteroidia bacterium]|nr:DNA-processing protein DprA [Bacteroidia bacterium]